VLKKIIWAVVIGAALFFAVQGGEYSSWDLFVLHSRARKLTVRVDSLQRQVDSLGRYLKLVKSDSATMERIAREEFGMVRGNNEILYRFGDAPEASEPRPR
jgi:cell division protein FtsB